MAVDNLESTNSWGRCGVKKDGAWVGKYSGAKVDPAYATAVADWLGWLHAEANGAGLCVAGNNYYSGRDIAGFRKTVEPLDIEVDEHGFTRNCKPMDRDQAWVDRITTFRDVARTKPVVIIDQVCPKLEQANRQVLDWSLASYLLFKGDRSYIAITSSTEYGGYYDLPELYLPVGRPLGDFENDSKLYWRRFEHAMAIVNPYSKAAATFDLGRKPFADTRWQDLDGAARTGTITLNPTSAIILMPAAERK